MILSWGDTEGIQTGKRWSWNILISLHENKGKIDFHLLRKLKRQIDVPRTEKPAVLCSLSSRKFAILWSSGSNNISESTQVFLNTSNIDYMLALIGLMLYQQILNWKSN